MAEEMAKEIIQPVPVAFLLCNQIITEIGTNKNTVVGIFDQIGLQKFPADYGPIALYARLYDGEGRYEFEIEYVATKDQRQLDPLIKGEFTVKARFAPIDLTIKLPHILIPQPGQYEFRLWIQKRYTQKIVFTAVKAAEGERK